MKWVPYIMNVRNKKIIILLSAILIFGAGIGVYIFSKKEMLPNVIAQEKTNPNELSPETIALLESYRGVIASSTTKGYNTYTNKKEGVSLSFPEKWRVVVGSELWDGGLHFFNFPKSEKDGLFNNSLPMSSGPEDFYKWDGKNYTAVSLGIGSTYAETGEIYLNSNLNSNPRSDSYMKEYGKKKVVIDGQHATRFDYEGHFGLGFARVVTYMIPPPNSTNDSYIRLSMYGDPSNFSQLDELVKTIKWLPVENKQKGY